MELPWETPEFFAFAYNVAGGLMLLAAIFTMNKLNELRLHRLSIFTMISIWVLSVAVMILGIGLVFKVFGTIFGEWLLLSGDILLSVGMVAIVISIRESHK